MNFIILLCTAGLAFFTLLKDWQAHKHPVRQFSVLGLILVALIGGSFNLWIASKRAEMTEQQRSLEKAQAAEHIITLQKSVDAEREARHIDTEQFLAELSKVYNKLSDLQTSQKTRQLKQEILNLQESLKTSDKAAAEVVRLHSAKLGFGFFTPDINKTPPNVTIAQLAEGYVSVEVTAFNDGGADASNGFIYLRICEGCKFKEEPERTRRVTGAMEKEREMPFSLIGLNMRLEKFTLKIIPPGYDTFQIGFRYVCQTCSEDDNWQALTVNVAK